MKVFNTLTKKKEEFVPLEEGKVRMYVCGPTVYDYIHIGNARPVIFFDTVRGYLEQTGHDVNYVVNFTDVDDKLIRKAEQLGTGGTTTTSTAQVRKMALSVRINRSIPVCLTTMDNTTFLKDTQTLIYVHFF